MPKERDVIKMIWTNFVNSLRPRQFKGNYMGRDTFGNKYFEIPADPSIGKRKPSRWFEPANTKQEDLNKFDSELSSEWEAWLRGRRQVPPTEEEVLRNKAIADMKKVNAAELDKEYHPEKAIAPPKREESSTGYPKYEEYEVMPGEKDK